MTRKKKYLLWILCLVKGSYLWISAVEAHLQSAVYISALEDASYLEVGTLTLGFSPSCAVGSLVTSKASDSTECRTAIFFPLELPAGTKCEEMIAEINGRVYPTHRLLISSMQDKDPGIMITFFHDASGFIVQQRQASGGFKYSQSIDEKQQDYIEIALTLYHKKRIEFLQHDERPILRTTHHMQSLTEENYILG